MKSIINKVIVFTVILSFFASNTAYGAADIPRYKDTLRTTAMANSIMPAGNATGTAELIKSFKTEKPLDSLESSSSGNIVDIVSLQYKKERTNRKGKAWKAYDRIGALLKQFIEAEIPYSSIRQLFLNYADSEAAAEKLPGYIKPTLIIIPTLIRLNSVNGAAYLGLEKDMTTDKYELIFVGAESYCSMPMLEPIEIAALVEAAEIKDAEEKEIWKDFLEQMQKKMGYFCVFAFSKSEIGSEDYIRVRSKLFDNESSHTFVRNGIDYMNELRSDVEIFYTRNTICVVTGQTIKKFSRLTGAELSFGQPYNIDSVEVSSIGELLKYAYIPEDSYTYKYLKKNIKKETHILAAFGAGYFYFAAIGSGFKMYDMREEKEHTFSLKMDVFDFAKRGNNLYIAGIGKDSRILKELDVRTWQITDIKDFRKTPFLDILRVDNEIIITKQNVEGDYETRHYNLKKPLLERYLPFSKSSSAGIQEPRGIDFQWVDGYDSSILSQIWIPNQSFRWAMNTLSSKQLDIDGLNDVTRWLKKTMPKYERIIEENVEGSKKDAEFNLQYAQDTVKTIEG